MNAHAQPATWPRRSRGRHRAARHAGPLHRAGTGWQAPAMSSFLLVVLLALTVFVAYGTVIDNRWYKILAIEGGSMQPTILAGDAIVITRPPDVIDEGMILTFEVEGHVVTHRVVGVQGDRLITRGDANDAIDEWEAHVTDVRGHYRFKVPWLGYLIGG